MFNKNAKALAKLQASIDNATLQLAIINAKVDGMLDFITSAGQELDVKGDSTTDGSPQPKKKARAPKGSILSKVRDYALTTGGATFSLKDIMDNTGLRYEQASSAALNLYVKGLLYKRGAGSYRLVTK